MITLLQLGVGLKEVGKQDPVDLSRTPLITVRMYWRAILDKHLIIIIIIK